MSSLRNASNTVVDDGFVDKDYPKPRDHSPAARNFAGLRRSATAPVLPAPAPEPSSSRAGAGLVETLYAHPSVKIVSFNAGSRPADKAPAADVEPGSLPWSSRLERTIAVGTFPHSRDGPELGVNEC